MTSPIADLFDLRGTRAIVTGGASGIGRAVTRRFRECGADVLAVDLDEAALSTLDAQTVGKGRLETFVTDLTDFAVAPDLVVAQAVDRLGGADVLVNNAGLFPRGDVLELSEEDWDRVADVNLKAVFFLTQAFLRSVLASDVARGSIVNIASKAGLRPSGGMPHYSAAKAGVVMLTRSLARELGASGVRVNAVAPGGVRTEGAARAARALGYSGLDEVEPGVTSSVPLGRLADPDEIATVVLFLASDASSFMHGEVIAVDGGALTQ